MIAFFDYLVQQEFEEWSSESSNQNSDHTSENSSRPDSPTSDTSDRAPTHSSTVKLPRHHRGEIQTFQALEIWKKNIFQLQKVIDAVNLLANAISIETE